MLYDLIIESFNKDRKGIRFGRNIVRNFNKDLLPEHVKFYLIYYYFLIAFLKSCFRDRNDRD